KTQTKTCAFCHGAKCVRAMYAMLPEDSAEMVACHVLQCFFANNALSVQLAPIEQHLAETHVVFGCRQQTTTTGLKSTAVDKVAGRRTVVDFQLSGTWVKCVVGTKTCQFFRRHLEEGIFHLQRLENSLLKELAQRLTGHSLNQRTKHIS